MHWKCVGLRFQLPFSQLCSYLQHLPQLHLIWSCKLPIHTIHVRSRKLYRLSIDETWKLWTSRQIEQSFFAWNEGALYPNMRYLIIHHNNSLTFTNDAHAFFRIKRRHEINYSWMMTQKYVGLKNSCWHEWLITWNFLMNGVHFFHLKW